VALNWISVDEQIPVMRELVLVCGNNVEVEKGYLSTYYLDENKNVTYEWTIPGHGYTYNVTHWMPLPKPYKKPGPFEGSFPYVTYKGKVIWSYTEGNVKRLVERLNQLWGEQ